MRPESASGAWRPRQLLEREQDPRDLRLATLDWSGERILRKPGCVGAIDQPAGDHPMPRESLTVGGWTLFLDGTVSRVEILIDGELAGRARLGLPRADIASLPDTPASPAAPVCGFEWTADPAKVPGDRDSVRIEALVTGTDGQTFDLRLPWRLELQPPEHRFEDTTGHAVRLREKTQRAVRPRVPRSRDGMNLLAFTHRLDLGGAQRYFFEQIRYLMHDPSFSCTVVAPMDGIWRQRFERIGADVLITPYPATGVTEYETAVGQLAAWADAHEFDVVFANTLDAFIGADMASRVQAPLAWSIHESFHLRSWWEIALGGSGHPYVRDRVEHALGEASALIFAAEATQRLFEPFASPTRMVTAPYGLELGDIDDYRRRFTPERRRQQRSRFSEDAVILLCLGTVIARKAQSVLIQAFGEVAADHPEAHLVMVGDSGGDYSAGIKSFSARSGLESRCSLLPLTSDPYSWHEVADVFVLSSDIESSPISILEAMAFETPVLASGVFGVPELIEDGRHGYLCEANEVGDLAAALDRVLRVNPEERERIARAGADRVRTRHDPERYSHSLRRLLTELADKPGATPQWEVEPPVTPPAPPASPKPALRVAEPASAPAPETLPVAPERTEPRPRPIEREKRPLSPAVVIDEIIDVRGDGARVPAEASLDAPTPGTEQPSYALRLAGWAFDPSSPTAAVELMQDGRLWHRVPADQERPDLIEAFPDQPHAASCGFQAVFGALTLSSSFELSVDVLLGNGERLPTWRIRGRRRQFGQQTGQTVRIRPIVLNALGRTGSTWLTQLLDQHPEIVVYRPFEYEPRIASYWLEVLRNLSEPQSYLTALRPRLDGPRWWLGDGLVPSLPPDDDHAFEHALGSEAIEELADFCRRRTEEAYVSLALQRGKPDSSYFVEKAAGYAGAGDALRRLWTDLYGDSRELLLVRDLRDVVCSMLAYDKRRGFVGFGRQFTSDDREFLERLRGASRYNFARHEALGDRSMLVRYEDLIERPEHLLAEVFQHLSIEASETLVADVVERASGDTPGMRFHRTAGKPSASVGRWRRDMSTELRELAEEVFAQDLADMGYDLHQVA